MGKEIRLLNDTEVQILSSVYTEVDGERYLLYQKIETYKNDVDEIEKLEQSEDENVVKSVKEYWGIC